MQKFLLFNTALIFLSWQSVIQAGSFFSAPSKPAENQQRQGSRRTAVNPNHGQTAPQPRALLLLPAPPILAVRGARSMEVDTPTPHTGATAQPRQTLATRPNTRHTVAGSGNEPRVPQLRAAPLPPAPPILAVRWPGSMDVDAPAARTSGTTRPQPPAPQAHSQSVGSRALSPAIPQSRYLPAEGPSQDQRATAREEAIAQTVAKWLLTTISSRQERYLMHRGLELTQLTTDHEAVTAAHIAQALCLHRRVSLYSLQEVLSAYCPRLYETCFRNCLGEDLTQLCKWASLEIHGEHGPITGWFNRPKECDVYLLHMLHQVLTGSTADLTLDLVLEHWQILVVHGMPRPLSAQNLYAHNNPQGQSRQAYSADEKVNDWLNSH